MCYRYILMQYSSDMMACRNKTRAMLGYTFSQSGSCCYMNVSTTRIIWEIIDMLNSSSSKPSSTLSLHCPHQPQLRNLQRAWGICWESKNHECGCIIHDVVDSMSTPGVHVEFRHFFSVGSPAKFLSRIHLESNRSPPGLQLLHLDNMECTSEHREYESTQQDSIWSPHELITFNSIIPFII